MDITNQRMRLRIKLDLIRDELVTKYGIDFEKNYVELEFIVPN